MFKNNHDDSINKKISDFIKNILSSNVPKILDKDYKQLSCEIFIYSIKQSPILLDFMKQFKKSQNFRSDKVVFNKLCENKKINWKNLTKDIVLFLDKNNQKGNIRISSDIELEYTKPSGIILNDQFYSKNITTILKHNSSCLSPYEVETPIDLVMYIPFVISSFILPDVEQ